MFLKWPHLFSSSRAIWLGQIFNEMCCYKIHRIGPIVEWVDICGMGKNGSKMKRWLPLLILQPDKDVMTFTDCCNGIIGLIYYYTITVVNYRFKIIFDKLISFISNLMFHNSRDKFDWQIIVPNQINQIESWRKRRCCSWIRKRLCHHQGLNSRPGHGAANQCAEPSVIPLSYPATPYLRLFSMHFSDTLINLSSISS